MCAAQWKILASLYGFFFGAAILFTVARALVDHRQRIRNLCSPLELAVNYRPMFVTLLVDHGARLEHLRPEHQRCITPQMWHHQQSVVLCLRVRHALIVHIQRINAHVDRRLLRMIFAHYVWPARHHIVPSVSVATNVRATCFNAPPSVQPGIVVRATIIAREVCDAWMAENEAE